jgi:multiple sugar transport system permease protein
MAELTRRVAAPVSRRAAVAWRARRDRRARTERRLAWLLCAPAVLVMLVVTVYPVAYALVLSLQRYDLRFPDQRGWVWFDNYAALLGSEVFRADLLATVLITVASVSLELLVGMAFALVMHRTVVARRTVRTVLLLPYGLVAVVAAFAWQYAFTPELSFFTDRAWLSERWSSFAVIVATEVWQTTPLISLLLLAGLSVVPEEMLEIAEVDGATPWQRFWQVTMPSLRPVLLVAVLFRTLDTLRVFDSVYVLTGGANGTETLSLGVWSQLVDRLNLGLGSAFSVLLFALAALVAAVFLWAFSADIAQVGGEE